VINRLVRAMFPRKPSASCGMIGFSIRIVSELPAVGKRFQGGKPLWHAACTQEACELDDVGKAMLTRVIGKIREI